MISQTFLSYISFKFRWRDFCLYAISISKLSIFKKKLSFFFLRFYNFVKSSCIGNKSCYWWTKLCYTDFQQYLVTMNLNSSVFKSHTINKLFWNCLFYRIHLNFRSFIVKFFKIMIICLKNAISFQDFFKLDAIANFSVFFFTEKT